MPELEGWIRGDNIIHSNSGRRDLSGAIEMTYKTIASKEGLNLQLPHKVIGLSELGDVAHVDIENCLVVDVDSVGNSGW